MFLCDSHPPNILNILLHPILMSILRFKPLLVRRQLPRLIFFLAIVLLLVSYYRCSPYVCPPRTTLSEEGGYPEGGTQDADDTVSIKHDPPPKSAPPSKAAVVASLKGDDTSWLHEYFPDWQPNIYVMNDRKAKLTVAKNKGRESMAYLTYIIDVGTVSWQLHAPSISI